MHTALPKMLITSLMLGLAFGCDGSPGVGADNSTLTTGSPEGGTDVDAQLPVQEPREPGNERPTGPGMPQRPDREADAAPNVPQPALPVPEVDAAPAMSAMDAGNSSSNVDAASEPTSAPPQPSTDAGAPPSPPQSDAAPPVASCAVNNGGCGDPTFYTCTDNTGTLPTCMDIDECATNNGGCGDAALFDCTNNVGAGPTCAPVDVATTPPNVLLIIADDLGIDASAQYNVSSDLPVTPVLNELAAEGIVFDNAWATPSCTTTRGTLITGKHGINSGVDTVPNLMDTTQLTLQRYLTNETDYQSAVVGKWHLAGAGDTGITHPQDSGVPYYAGNIAGNLSSYFEWPLVTNGVQTDATEYHTTAATDLAIDWIAAQTQPWFMWLAYVAPHSPFHLPPEALHSRGLSGTAADIMANPRAYYLASIEAMDTEIGRLLDSMSAAERDNTLIVFVGDNGTGARVVDTTVFERNRAKGSLYEGGVRVPMIASGAGVTRIGEREAALVNTVDFFPTIAELAGSTVDEGIDGQSFYGLLSDAAASSREFNYSEFVSDNVTGWTVRNDTFKLIRFDDGSQELYRLPGDISEVTDLIANGTAGFEDTIVELEGFAAQIRGEAPANPNPAATDITDAILMSRGASCVDYVDNYRSDATDVQQSIDFEGSLEVQVDGLHCILNTNAIPNHSFNDGDRPFPNPVAAQDDMYRIVAEPTFAQEVTELTLVLDNGLLLNGAKVDLLAAACFNVGDERVGCNDPTQPWRFDPMHAPNGFRVDSHNAHTQPDGSYHYHGPPRALYDDSGVSPIVGFAADGFPIFGSYIDDNGSLRQATSSYQLKAGMRPTGEGNPGGTYDGTYRDDYEYVDSSGDLDECNGMTVNGTYGYYITEAFPYMMACFRGTPDDSFLKR